MKTLLKLTFALLVTLPLNSISQIVAQPPNIHFTKTDVSCYGGSDGVITTSIVGGQPPYTYIWDGVVNEPSMDGLSSGIYHLKVIDVVGNYTERLIEIKQPTKLKILGDISHPSSLSATDGGVEIDVKGGVKFKRTSFPYDFQWSNDSENLNLNNVGSGAYTLTVTDYNGCSLSKTFKLKGNLNFVSYELENNSLNLNNVYPNPATEGQDVNITYNKSLINYIFIISEENSTISFGSLDENGELVISNLKSGNYYVKFFNGKTLVDSYRLMVQ